MQPSYRFGTVAILPWLLLASACSSGDFSVVRDEAGTGSSSGGGSGAGAGGSPGGGSGATSSGSSSGTSNSGVGSSGASASGAGSSGSGGGTCSKSSPCPGGFFCSTPDGQCNASGTCQAFDPQAACDALFMPVCGCDGTTYGNSCDADVHGVSIASQGACAGSADGGRCVRNVLCTTTSHWDPNLCRCVPNSADAGPADGGRCVQNVLCTTTSHWDPNLCRCVPNDYDAGDAGGPICGSVRCPAGEYCCNPLQSLCAPPGVACIAQ